MNREDFLQVYHDRRPFDMGVMDTRGVVRRSSSACPLLFAWRRDLPPCPAFVAGAS